MFVYLIVLKPFQERNMNLLEIFNELCILTYSYMLILFSDFVEISAIKYNIGWVSIGLVLFNILVNTLVIDIMTLRVLKDNLKKHCLKKKNNNHQLSMTQTQHNELRNIPFETENHSP